jgi:hypothetical protein
MARGMQRLEERGCTRLHPPNPIHMSPSRSHDPHRHPNPQSPSTSTSISWFISWDLPLLPIVRCPFLIRKGCGRAAGRSDGWAACETWLRCTRALPSFVAAAKCSRCAYVCCRNCRCFSLIFLRVSRILEEILTDSLLFLWAEIFGALEWTQVRSFLVVLQTCKWCGVGRSWNCELFV